MSVFARLTLCISDSRPAAYYIHFHVFVVRKLECEKVGHGVPMAGVVCVCILILAFRVVALGCYVPPA